MSIFSKSRNFVYRCKPALICSMKNIFISSINKWTLSNDWFYFNTINEATITTCCLVRSDHCEVIVRENKLRRFLKCLFLVEPDDKSTQPCARIFFRSHTELQSAGRQLACRFSNPTQLYCQVDRWQKKVRFDNKRNLLMILLFL